MKSFRYIGILLACLIGLGIGTADAKVTFKAIPRQNVVEGQNFNITFRISAENEDVSGVSLPTPPNLKGCRLLSGPNVTSSQSTTIINGKMSSQEIYDLVCIYRAESQGKVTVPSISITAKGATYRSEEITFEILPPDASSTPQGSTMPGASSQQPASSGPSGKDFFVRVSFSKASIYEQEGIIATTKLYRPNDRKFSLSLEAVPSMPVYEGFLSEELKASADPQVENYNGKNYVTYELAKVLLFPQKAGTLKVTSGTYTLRIQEQVGVIRMHAFATPRYDEYTYTTPLATASLTVNELPKPQPADFCGAVGNYSIDASLAPEQLRTNESATYTLTFKGTGNVKYLTMPTVSFPATFDKYTPRSDVKASISGQTFTGSYTAEFPIVPQEQGVFEIPAQTFSYFNLATKSYETLTTKPFTCKVERGTTVATTVEQKTIDTEMQDILHIHTLGAQPSKASDTPLFFSLWYWCIWIGLALALLVSVFVYRKRLQLAADVVGRRTARANRVASKRFKAAAAFMKADRSEAFYEELARALKGYVSDKLGIPPSQLISDTIADKLKAYGAQESTANDVIEVLNDCEMARFTPSQSQSAMNELYNRASKAIKEIEDIKMKPRTAVTAILLLLCAIPSFALTEAQLGDSAYNKENYREAISHYQAALAQDGRSSDVYYNLGNANYRCGEIARAVLAYERALRIDPANKDARSNLEFVNSRLEDKPEDNNSILARAHTAVVESASADTWALITVIAFLLVCAAVALYIFSNNVRLRKAGFFGGFILLVLTVYFVVVAYNAARRVDDHCEAIVTVPSTLLNSVPRMPKETEKIVPLHQGTKVEILDSVATPDDPVSPRWYKVRINGSTGAWLRATDVERI